MSVRAVTLEGVEVSAVSLVVRNPRTKPSDLLTIAERNSFATCS
jgi:hypothetical protein